MVKDVAAKAPTVHTFQTKINGSDRFPRRSDIARSDEMLREGVVAAQGPWTRKGTNGADLRVAMRT